MRIAMKDHGAFLLSVQQYIEHNPEIADYVSDYVAKGAAVADVRSTQVMTLLNRYPKRDCLILPKLKQWCVKICFKWGSSSRYKRGIDEMNNEFEKLLGNYFDVGVREGREGRDYDTPDGAAWKALTAVKDCVNRMVLAGRDEKRDAPDLALVSPMKKFQCFSIDEGDSWYDHPADAEILESVDAKNVGDEYELMAGWRSITARYKIVELKGDDVEVECISHAEGN